MATVGVIRFGHEVRYAVPSIPTYPQPSIHPLDEWGGVSDHGISCISNYSALRISLL